MQKELWIRADVPDKKDSRKKIVISALEHGISNAIVRKEDEDFSSFGKVNLLFNENNTLSGNNSGCIVNLKTPDDQKKVLDLAGKMDIIVLSTSDWTIIPLENMIAKFRGTGTRIFACATNADQARLYFTTLEKGVDGIVIENTSDIDKIKDVMKETAKLKLDTVTVTNVKDVGIGDRVCVDTCSIMFPGEGMLVGSQSACLFLIQSESEETGYVAARPFRVNAGAVHAYAMTPDGGTRYLSELKSGDPVMIVDHDGGTSSASIGRCKIERRPMIMIETEVDGKRFTTILQNAETVKMVGPDGAVSVSKLKKGDKIFAKLELGGRHFGMKVDETIREL